VINWSHKSDRVRLKVPVRVPHDSDLDQAALALMREAASYPERVLAVPAPNALIMAFGETAIELELRFWIQDAQNGVHNIKSQVLTRSGDCFSSKAFAFHTPSGIFMYAPMRRPLLLRLVIGDIADREAVRAVISSFSRFG
jgi:small-conductance mechanosensitive channel